MGVEKGTNVEEKGVMLKQTESGLETGMDL